MKKFTFEVLFILHVTVCCKQGHFEMTGTFLILLLANHKADKWQYKFQSDVNQ